MLKRDYKIQTAQLELSCFTPADLDDMMELRSDPDNTPYAPDDLWKSEQDARGFFDFAALFYDNNPKQPKWFRYFFAIRELGQQKVIGYCGIGAPDFDRSVTEVFYALLHTKWNRGYATEAAKAMLEFGFHHLKLQRIIGFIHPDNIGSRRVLEKAGLKEIGALNHIPEAHDFFGDTLFEITRETYAQLKQRMEGVTQ